MFARGLAAVTGTASRLRSRPRLTQGLALLALIGVTATVYWPVTGHGFLSLDDPEYVSENSTVRDGLTIEGLHWAFSAAHEANWHPVSWLSHMLDVELFGLDAGGHHATNLALHLMNTLLLFVFLSRATAARWPSLIVATVFALHPVQVESVAWISERKELLSTFFGLLALNSYVSYARRGGGLRYAAVVALLAIGLMAKPMLVTLPFLLLLLDYWPLRRFQIFREKDLREPVASRTVPARAATVPRLLLQKLPLAALSLVSSVIAVSGQASGSALMPADLLSLPDRVANALVSYGRYLAHMLWPNGLSPFYPPTPHSAEGRVGRPGRSR